MTRPMKIKKAGQNTEQQWLLSGGTVWLRQTSLQRDNVSRDLNERREWRDSVIEVIVKS